MLILKNLPVRTFLASTILLLLFLIAFFSLWHEAQRAPEQVMTEHIQKLAEIFDTIHKQYVIIGFDHAKNYIDFLNVNSFEGSQIGSMNLAYPHLWKTAFLKDNFTMQEKQYQVIKTKNGYFIVPGAGVRLSNGLIMGKDIIIDEQTDITPLLLKDGPLQFQGKPLAAPIKTNTHFATSFSRAE